MAKYILKQGAISVLANEAKTHNNPVKRAYARAVALIEQITAEDVQPVKRGKWLQHGKPDDYFWCCSACKKRIIYAEHDLHKHHFCGNCGARMDSDTE